MAAELEGTGVIVVSIWPPGSRTEGILAEPETVANVDLDNWKPPLFTGRVVAALAAEDTHGEPGQAIVITDLAEELGISS